MRSILGSSQTCPAGKGTLGQRRKNKKNDHLPVVARLFGSPRRHFYSTNPHTSTRQHGMGARMLLFNVIRFLHVCCNPSIK